MQSVRFFGVRLSLAVNHHQFERGDRPGEHRRGEEKDCDVADKRRRAEARFGDPSLAGQMRSGEQIFQFGQAVDKALAEVQPQLPPDLIVERTSDQPRQVAQ